MIDLLLPFKVFYTTQKILFSESILLGLIVDVFMLGLIFIVFESNGDFISMMDKLDKVLKNGDKRNGK